MPSSIAVPGEMAKENAVTGGNETPTPSSEEKVKEIQARLSRRVKKMLFLLVYFTLVVLCLELV